MIEPQGYEVLCNGCRHMIDIVPTLEEAKAIERDGRNCINVAGEVYCCEDCARKAGWEGDAKP